MAAETVKIEKLRIRAPGLGPDEGRMLGQEVAQRLARGLSPNVSTRTVRRLNLRAPIKRGMQYTETAAKVAEAILKGLD